MKLISKEEKKDQPDSLYANGVFMQASITTKPGRLYPIPDELKKK